MDTAKRSAWGRGTIREHHGSYQVRVPAGTDPVTGERLTLHGTAQTPRQAEKLRTKLLTEADTFKLARTNATLGYLLDRWLPQHDVDDLTRSTYESLIRLHIRSALGDVPLTTLVRKATETLERFYAELRRCKARCDGRTFVDHAVTGVHDCTEAGCSPHECRPLSAATLCRIHAVLSAACRAAVRWGWIPFNPTEAARVVEAATKQNVEWGLYLWLAIVTGARHGELCALRWANVDLDTGAVTIRRNCVAGREKDPKTHQMRRVSVDDATVELLRRHRGECAANAALLDGSLDPMSFARNSSVARICTA